MYLKIFDILSRDTVQEPMEATKASGYLRSLFLIYPQFLKETLFWYSLFVQGFKSLEKYAREEDLRTLSGICFW